LSPMLKQLSTMFGLCRRERDHAIGSFNFVADVETLSTMFGLCRRDRDHAIQSFDFGSNRKFRSPKNILSA